MRPHLIVTLLCLSVAGPALAQDGSSKRDTLLRAARDFIVPHYEMLAQAAKTEQADWKAFCASPGKGEIEKLKEDYQQAADAWAGIEFVLYGPISRDFRFERMAHWPERKNAIGRGLSNLLSRKDQLTPERFGQTSAAVQGLSALERLLYEPDAPEALTNGSQDAKRRCDIGQAIAGNLARTSAQVLDEWREPGGVLNQLEKADEAKLDEVATRLATDYITLFEIIDDQKLGPVMGDSIDSVRPKLAESWRSGRSMRSIVLNLKAANALGHILVDPSSDGGVSLDYALRTALRMAESAPADIGQAAADPKQRSNLNLLRDAVHSLRETAQSSVPAALGITMGFNSSDGD